MFMIVYAIIGSIIAVFGAIGYLVSENKPYSTVGLYVGIILDIIAWPIFILLIILHKEF